MACRAGGSDLQQEEFVMRQSSLAAVTASLVTAVLIAAGCVAVGPPPGPPATVVICHKGKTMELPEPAVQAHLGHGDSLGPCP